LYEIGTRGMKVENRRRARIKMEEELLKKMVISSKGRRVKSRRK
jgi:hypothetical protein